MNGLYPEILFHFTYKIGVLEGILINGFRPSFCRETIDSKSGSKNFYVPMISFCDLRFSELSTHMEDYGKYGIGMTKEWAFRMGLNPVAYVNKDSDFANSLLSGLTEYADMIKTHEDWNDKLKGTQSYLKILNVERFIKNYEGNLIRESTNYGLRRFANEREWRYVLPLDTEDILPFIPDDFIDNNVNTNKEFYNNKISKRYLKFSPQDVKYLIVESDKDIDQIKGIINSLPSVDYNDAAKQHLLSRILSANQIEEDF